MEATMRLAVIRYIRDLERDLKDGKTKIETQAVINQLRDRVGLKKWEAA